MADEEKKEELELTEVTEEETAKKEDSNNGDESLNEEGNSDSSEEDFVKKDKNTLIKKILIGVVSFLVLILITGIILYAVGFFDEPEPEVKENSEKTTQTTTVKNEIQNQEYKFDISDINSTKLNKKLELLTNKHIQEDKKKEELDKLENEKKILEEEKKKHQEAITQEEQKLEQEKELLEAKKNELEMQKNELENLRLEALLLKEQLEKDKKSLESLVIEKEQEKELIEEEFTNNKEEQDTTEENNFVEKNTSENNENPFLLLINIAKIKGQLYKSYLDEIIKINPDITLCRDDKNRIEIYYGPFSSNENRKILFEKLQKNNFSESFEVELTKEEFNKRCKY